MVAHYVGLLVIVSYCTIAHGRTYLWCDCSPSSRGYGMGAMNELREGRMELKKLRGEMEREAKSDASITTIVIDRRIMTETFKMWSHCVDNHSNEECVNADAALRLDDDGDGESFCRFNEVSWKNLKNGGQVQPDCDSVKAFASMDVDIINGNADRKSVARPSPPVSKQRVTGEKKSAGRAPAVVTPTPGSAEAALPISAVGEGEGKQAEEIGRDEEAMDTNEMDAEASLEPVLPLRLNEGCVAVEHLQGYVLQHRHHLRRPVLCGQGICATANHVLVVDGRRTSMKRLCEGEWECVTSVKLVNNLKISSNTRARFNHRIVITPYDIRFPVSLIWLAQIAEDVAYVLFSAVVVGVATASAVVVHASVV